MHFSAQALVVALLVVTAAAKFTPASTSGTDELAANALLNIALEETKLALAGETSSCTLDNAHVRRECKTYSFQNDGSTDKDQGQI